MLPSIIKQFVKYIIEEEWFSPLPFLSPIILSQSLILFLFMNKFIFWAFGQKVLISQIKAKIICGINSWDMLYKWYKKEMWCQGFEKVWVFIEYSFCV